MNVQAIAVMGSTLLTAHKKEVVAAVAKVRLPSIYSISDFPYAGGLLAYASNLSDRFRQAGISQVLTKPCPPDVIAEELRRLLRAAPPAPLL